MKEAAKAVTMMTRVKNVDPSPFMFSPVFFNMQCVRINSNQEPFSMIINLEIQCWNCIETLLVTAFLFHFFFHLGNYLKLKIRWKIERNKFGHHSCDI